MGEGTDRALVVLDGETKKELGRLELSAERYAQLKRLAAKFPGGAIRAEKCAQVLLSRISLKKLRK